MGGINAQTVVCGIIGYPVRHSASPAMHNAAFQALGLNWVYVAFEVSPDGLEVAVRGAGALRLAGLNVTVPHKIAAMKFLDSIDEWAQLCGAVNTIRFEGLAGGEGWVPVHKLGAGFAGPVRAVGFNTDGAGFLRSLQEDLKFDPQGKRILVVGTGGAGRVVAMQLAACGAGEIFLVNRTETRAQEVASELRWNWPQVKVTVGYPSERVDLLVNATTLGMKVGDPIPLDLEAMPLTRVGAVYDLIYRPHETPLLRLAREAGIPAANGLGMLLYQGALAFEIWTGIPAPIEVMRSALEKEIYGS